MEIVTLKEVAAFLKAKPATVYAWARNGKIPSYKANGLLRFDMDEILAWFVTLRQSPRNVTLGLKPKKQDVNRIIKKTIEDVTGKSYNRYDRETGLKSRSQ